MQPGYFETVKACAYYMPEHNVSQVCMSLTDYKTASMHTVFDACCKEAKVYIYTHATIFTCIRV